MIELKADVAVVGMGYVGIPLSCLLAKAGHGVIGIDINQERANLINQGKLPLKGEEPELPELLREQVDRGLLHATTDFSYCRKIKVVFVCVDTPIDENKIPRFDRLIAVMEQIGRNISSGVLVVVESTIAPGTMSGKILPLLEKMSGLKGGENLFLAHCPERVMSGKLIHNLKNIDRIIGGLDERSTEMAIRWYSQIVVGKLHTTDMTTAEAVKTAENAYRDVQIAFANEVGLICEKLGLDAFEVRRLVNTCPQRDMHKAGAGVGGHCLPKDTWLLAYGGKEADPKLMPIARQINDAMPEHMAELVIEMLGKAGLADGKETCVGIFGLSYLENSGDTRNTPARTVIEHLRNRYRVIVQDPYISAFENVEIESDLENALRMADCAVFLIGHREYSTLTLERIAELMRHKIIVDGRNLFDKKKAKDLGILYAGVGKG